MSVLSDQILPKNCSVGLERTTERLTVVPLPLERRSSNQDPAINASQRDDLEAFWPGKGGFQRHFWPNLRP